ncbi:MAG: YceI family protein [Acidimicrobiales bacterium]
MRYAIDPGRSRVWIEARSSLHPVRSQSGGLEGFVEATVDQTGSFDLRSAPQGRLELAVSGLSSGNPLYDREMRRCIDSRHHPVISGDVRDVRPAGEPKRYVVDGDVTFAGATRPASDVMQLSVEEDATVILEGEHVFDIREFGIEPPRIMMLRVHPEVKVRVRIVAGAR